MSVPSLSRLERLTLLTSSDLEALPDRPPQQNSQPTADEDDQSTGGVALEPENPTPASPCLLTHRSTPQQHPARGEAQDRTPTRISPTTLTHQSPNPEHSEPEKRFIHLPSQSDSLPLPTLTKGDLAPSGLAFTPILALSKYPYKFVSRNVSQGIASAFFDGGKFWARLWDVYYVWDLEGTKPLLLIRDDQVNEFLTEINQKLSLRLKITEEQKQEGFHTRFPYHPQLYPRYLGRPDSRDTFDTMAGATPSNSYRAPGEPSAPQPDERTLEAFKHMIEDGINLAKAKTKAMKARKDAERIVKNRTMVQHLKRAQRYLGLRPKAVPATTPAPALDPVDLSLPVPFAFDSDVVFICVDVESYERNHRLITEVGIASLDTRDLKGVAPGKHGLEWKDAIRCRHFRILEHRHLHNTEFVKGCAGSFEFGTSEFVSLADAPAAIAACFRPPFAKLITADEAAVVDREEKRNLIFLGHDTNTDINYLQQLGYNPLNLSNLQEALDTATMYRVWKREENPTSLGRILYDFDIIGWNLHNAGNDAFYTVQAMLAVCVAEAEIRGSTEAHSKRANEKLIEATKEAQAKAQEDLEIWNKAVDHHDDGGEPISLVKQLEEQKARSDQKAADKKVREEAQKERTAADDGNGKKRSSNEPTFKSGYDNSRGRTVTPRGGRGNPGNRGNEQRGGFNGRGNEQRGGFNGRGNEQRGGFNGRGNANRGGRGAAQNGEGRGFYNGGGRGRGNFNNGERGNNSQPRGRGRGRGSARGGRTMSNPGHPSSEGDGQAANTPQRPEASGHVQEDLIDLKSEW